MLRAALLPLLLIPSMLLADGPQPPAAKTIDDISIRLDYTNEIKGDHLHKGKTYLLRLAFGDVLKCNDNSGRYLLRSVWIPDLQNRQLKTCAVFLIEPDKAKPFADLTPNDTRVIVKATCIGKVSGEVCFIDTEFVRKEK